MLLFFQLLPVFSVLWVLFEMQHQKFKMRWNEVDSAFDS